MNAARKLHTRRTGIAAADLFVELCDLWGYHNITGSELRADTVRVIVTVETVPALPNQVHTLERHEYDFTSQTTYDEALHTFYSLTAEDQRDVGAAFRYCPPTIIPGWTPETNVTIRDPFLPGGGNVVVEDDGELS